MNIVDRFIMSREKGWKIKDEEFNEAVPRIVEDGAPENVYIVIDSTGTYLINKEYIRVKIVAKGAD